MKGKKAKEKQNKQKDYHQDEDDKNESDVSEVNLHLISAKYLFSIKLIIKISLF